MALTDAQRRARIAEKLAKLDQEKRERGSQQEGHTDHDYKPKEFTNGQSDEKEEFKTPFPFLKLPPEVQDRICGFAVSYLNTTTEEANRTKETNKVMRVRMPSVQVVKSLSGKRDKIPALLRASSTVRQMALPKYLQFNNFILKSSPRYDQHCPFSKWISSIGTMNSRHLANVTMSFHDDNRIYVEMVIQPELHNFPHGLVTLNWPHSRRGVTSTVAMAFKRKLGSKYPQASIDEHLNKSFTITADNILAVVEHIFQLGKQAAGGVSKEKEAAKRFTMSDALYGGYSNGTQHCAKHIQKGGSR